jgi:hypothetical protein
MWGYLLIPALGLVVWWLTRRLKQPELPPARNPMMALMDAAAADLAKAGHRMSRWVYVNSTQVGASCERCGGAVFVECELDGPGAWVNSGPPLVAAGETLACTGELPA